MSKIFVTVHEPSLDRAIERIESLPRGFDGIELRVDAFSRRGEELPLERFRRATTAPLMYTRRARAKEERATVEELWAAADAGFDLIDVEVALESGAVDLQWIAGSRNFSGTWYERVVFSYHDWNGVPEPLEQIVAQMSPFRFKLAVTPRSLDENLRLLRLLDSAGERSDLTLFGMGERGLYSRILAPFYGSQFIFVAADSASVAAPGQLTLDDAIAIYGDANELRRPDAVFAVTGNPAAHSRSPLIHNRLFREKGARAAYSIAEVGTFDEIASALLSDDPLAPVGLSITAPFKEEAFEFALAVGARLSGTAMRARAINTLVRFEDGSLQGGNTDVSGFLRLVGERSRGNTDALVIGAGGTARAALVALEQLGIPRAVTNRTTGKGEALAREFGARFVELAAIGAERFGLVIDTLPPSAAIELPAELTENATVFTADYTARRVTSARSLVDGLALLQAQAIEQSAAFMHALSSRRRRVI